jgi:acetoacetyl-CoA synthetase
MGELLWQPSEKQKSKAKMTEFMNFVNTRHRQSFRDYHELYQWSIADPADFWQDFWDFAGIICSKTYDQVVENFADMLNSRWFVGAKMNFAENLLRHRDEQVAMVFKGENCPPVNLTYAQLYDQVAKMAKSLREKGVGVGDRVVGFMPHMPETIIAMLGATSIGAIWSGCSPDFGINGVLERFGQIQPKVLIAADGYFYNGKEFDSLEKVQGIVSGIHSIEQVVIVPYLREEPNLDCVPRSVIYNDFISSEEGLTIEFAQLPFDHPVYILYSSGTTGVPKCIVHRAGGVLIQHMKEHLLHTNLTREDKLFYYTTCGWMMWHWSVSALAVGATLILYDGSAFYPGAESLWQLAEEQGITVFGTSAKYLASIEKAEVKPGSQFKLDSLHTILSTGSPLSEDSFHYVYREIKQDLCLASITGGTDLISTFALGNPLLPVYAGEIQCRGLGMKVESLDSAGNSLIGQKGELVCSTSFPTQPVGFWNDPEKVKYKKAYFDVFPNVWRHGDFVEITPEGGLIVFGRSDATLNPGGVRIGTSEIYRQVEGLSQIADSLVVGQDWDNDVRVILFVRPAEGIELTDELKGTIRQVIRKSTTPRHVPEKIIEIRDIPYTLNGKKVELAVRQVIHNEPVLNQEALANPEALEYYKDLAELTN